MEWEVNERFPNGVAYNLEHRRFASGARILPNVAKSSMEAAMLSIRFDRDFEKAIASLRWGSEFITRWFGKYFDAIRAAKAAGADPGTEGQVSPGIFEQPLFCCLLAGDWPLAARVAAWAIEPEVMEAETVNDGLALLYSALVLDDRKRFESTKINPKQLEKHVERHYPAAASAVMTRDQAAFDRFLEEADQQFALRARSRGNPDLLYGQGKDDNPLSFDFIAVGLCKIAHTRGMRVTKDSEVLPGALIRRWHVG
jgi:hypothetical protein